MLPSHHSIAETLSARELGTRELKTIQKEVKLGGPCLQINL